MGIAAAATSSTERRIEQNQTSLAEVATPEPSHPLREPLEAIRAKKKRIEPLSKVCQAASEASEKLRARLRASEEAEASHAALRQRRAGLLADLCEGKKTPDELASLEREMSASLASLEHLRREGEDVKPAIALLEQRVGDAHRRLAQERERLDAACYVAGKITYFESKQAALEAWAVALQHEAQANIIADIVAK